MALPRASAVTSAGAAIDVAMRLSLVVMAAIVLSAPPDDPRFEDKGIGPRAITFIAVLSLIVPAWWVVAGRGRRAFPVWSDVLWLSVLVADLGGNVLDLYNQFDPYDLLTHGHGTGAGTVVAAELLRLPALGAIGIAQVAHILLEAQEYYGDIVFGLDNVHGAGDVVNDLLAGLAGSLGYAGLHVWLRGRPIRARIRPGPRRPGGGPTA